MPPQPRQGLLAQPPFIFVIAVLSSIGGFLFGYDTGVISGAILLIKQDFFLTPFHEEALIAALLLFAALAAPFAGYLADRFGRRTTILGAALLFSVGALMMAFAPGIEFLIGARSVVGLSIGVVSLTVPLYVSELSPPTVRGFCVSINQLLITVGIVVAYGVDLAFIGTGNWRLMLGLSIVPSIVLFVAMLFLPETPRWLLRQGKEQQARKIFARMGNTTPQVETLVQQVLLNLHRQVGGIKELLDRKLRAPLIVGMLLALFQQITGINTVIYYAPTIFQLSGLESDQAAIFATVGVGIVNVLMTVVSLYLLDRVGRKPLLITGISGMVVGLFCIGLGWLLPGIGRTYMAIGSLMIYIAGFAVGLGTVAWLFIAEAYPLRVRGIAMSCGIFVNWIANFVVALTFLTLIDGIGETATFWCYAGLGVCNLLFVIFFVPETKKKTLEQIEAYWLKGNAPVVEPTIR